VTLHTTRDLQPNDPGGQLYLPQDVVADSAFPLTLADECTVQTVPHRADVLLPGAVEPEFPLQFRDPNRIARHPTDPSNP